MVIGIPAACGVRVRTFVISAFLGLLPGTLLFAHLGSGLGELLRAGRPIGIGSFLRPEIVLPLLGLACSLCCRSPTAAGRPAAPPERLARPPRAAERSRHVGQVENSDTSRRHVHDIDMLPNAAPQRPPTEASERGGGVSPAISSRSLERIAEAKAV